MSRNDGGAAYPLTWMQRTDQGRGERVEHRTPGMSLRDYFAAQYLIGRGPIDASHDGGRELLWTEMAADCYAAADALLAERAK